LSSIIWRKKATGQKWAKKYTVPPLKKSGAHVCSVTCASQSYYPQCMQCSVASAICFDDANFQQLQNCQGSNIALFDKSLRNNAQNLVFVLWN
jgi:hypothetical protein